MRYLILLSFVSCNADNEKASTISVRTIYDSISIKSLSDSLQKINTALAESIPEIQSKIEKLNSEKSELLRQLNDQDLKVIVKDSIKAYDDRDKIIADLRNRLNQKENEIASLRKQLDYKPQIDKVDRVPNEPILTEVEKPNDNSLIVQPVPSNNIDVYLIPFSKKAKRLMVYEAACNVSLINSLDGKLSGYYEGQHFFNGIPPGKYLIKLCTYFGNYKVIERTDEKQIITLQTSPPINLKQ